MPVTIVLSTMPGDDLVDDSWEASIRAEVESLREGALETLQNAVRDWNELDPEASPIPMPEAILEVLEAQVRDSFRDSGFTLTAKVKAGAETGTLSVYSSTFHGTWEEPPDYDCDVIWTVDPTTTPGT